jgi:hypothetical protein
MGATTDWFKACRWGVFTHYLTTPEMTADDWNRRVDSFDVQALAAQVASTGASYYFITLGQGSGHYCAPNATYDGYVGITPSKCSRRDLVSDLYDALQPYGIALMAYVPADGSNADPVARRGLQMTAHWSDPPEHDWSSGPHWRKFRLPEFQRRWEQVCRDWSLRFGRKVRGWWVDGAYAPEERYPEAEAPNYRTYAAALKSGNPDAIIAFNPGVRVPVISATPHEEFTAGELSDNLPLGEFGLLDNPAWGNYGPIPSAIGHAQFHLLNFHGPWWAAGPPRFPDALVVGVQRQPGVRVVVVHDLAHDLFHEHGDVVARSSLHCRGSAGLVHDGDDRGCGHDCKSGGHRHQQLDSALSLRRPSLVLRSE